MLRLTLGIPGFDEAQLPRVVAALCMTLILVNHTAGGGEVSAGQVTHGKATLLWTKLLFQQADFAKASIVHASG